MSVTRWQLLAAALTMLGAPVPALPAAAPAPDQVLNLYAWSEYFPAPVLRRFEAETGIKVNFSVFDSNDVVETTLSAGHSGFDLVTVDASPHLGRQIPRGLWQPLDLARIPNRGNVDRDILAILGRVDPGNRYAIPYVWGTIGILYNPAKIRPRMGKASLDSLGMVLDPAQVARFADCGVSILGTWMDMLPVISLYLGQPALTAEPAALDALATAYAQARPSIRRVTSSGYYEQLARGELCLAIGYSADAMVARRRAAALGTGITIDYHQPREGVPMYIDAFAIPADAPHPAAALRFIDFVLRPDVGAELAGATGFAIANAAAMRLMPAELRDNPIVYPGAEVRRRFYLGRGYTMDQTRLFARTWLHMKTGY